MTLGSRTRLKRDSWGPVELEGLMVCEARVWLLKSRFSFGNNLMDMTMNFLFEQITRPPV